MTMGGNNEKKEKREENNENVEPKEKKRRKGKKEKKGEQTGNLVDSTAAVVKQGTAPPTSAATPKPAKGYCFRCGEEGHSAK